MSTEPTTETESLPPDHESAAASRRDLTVSLATLLLGLAIVAFLTRYNYQIAPVWNMGGRSPGKSWEEYLLVNVTGLLFFPFLLIFVAFRQDADAFGFRPPASDAARIALLLFIVMLPFLFVASRFPSFKSYYPMQPMAAYSWTYFLYFEVSYGFYMFAWEWFYRGFLTFGLARRFGFPAAVILQTIAFGIMHVGKPTPEFLGSFVAGIALGWLAIRARSFLPCFALHWAVSITFDLLAIHGKAGGIF